MSIDFKAVLIRDPKKVKSDNWQETAHEWAVTINGESFSYFTGIGHREARGFSEERREYNRLKNASGLTELGMKELLKLSKPKPPDLDSVLECLISDADACNQSFEEWASDIGYSTDSRKALETYLECQANAVKLRKAKINIEEERNRLNEGA